MKQLTLHVGEETQILERAREKSNPTEMVVAPVELHRRNLQRRFREADSPKDAFEFEDFVGLSQTVVGNREFSTESIDRIDRLAAVRDILDDSAESAESPGSLPPAARKQDPQHVEQIRADVESVTNFSPERIAAWRETTAGLNEPIDVETEELLDTAVEIERRLRSNTSKSVSEMELVRRATRFLIWSGGHVWTDPYPDVNRVTVVGLSSISAPQADFIHALLRSTSLDVHVHLRERTGEYLRRRIPSLLEVENPGREIFE
jgi:ATP-dependent helicase/nuclease subunit B